MNHLFKMGAVGLALVIGVARAEPVLVDTAWLAARLGQPDLAVVDMTGDNMQYQRFHIPGAVRLPYQALVRNRPDGVSLRHEDAYLVRLLGQLGIGAETHVVVYDDMGGLNAGRLFWELERIGHRRVSVLDGGLVQWVLEGRKVDNIQVRPAPTEYRASAQGGRANEISHGEVRALKAGQDAVLLDVRTEQEYVGDPRDPRGGHIPGARWWPWDESVRFDAGFARKDAATLQQGLNGLGVADKQQPLAVYCRSGHRAAQSYLTLRSLGYENVRLYDGSMLEYERDRSAPLTRGRGP